MIVNDGDVSIKVPPKGNVLRVEFEKPVKEISISNHSDYLIKYSDKEKNPRIEGIIEPECCVTPIIPEYFYLTAIELYSNGDDWGKVLLRTITKED